MNGRGVALVFVTLVTACADAMSLPMLDGDASTSTATSTSTSTTSTSTTSSTSTSTSTTADATTTTSPTSDDGVGFIESPDGGHPNLECDLWKNDCPRGEKCMPYVSDRGGSWNATKCTPIARDPNAPGEPCTAEGGGVDGIDDCDASSMCWNVDPETSMGTCVGFCTGSEANPMCEDPRAECSITAEGLLTLCLPSCDPLVQDCGEEQGCYPMQDSFGCAPDGSGDTGAYADACDWINDCDPGLFCADASFLPDCTGPSCCAPFCDLSDANPNCPNALECTPWYEEGQSPPQFANVGACLLPEGA